MFSIGCKTRNEAFEIILLLARYYELEYVVDLFMSIYSTAREKMPIYGMNYWSQMLPFILKSLNRNSL